MQKTISDQSITSLLCGIIRQAFTEARRTGPWSEPWQWLAGQEAQEYCELLQVDHRAILCKMDQLEVEKQYKKPRVVVFLEAFCLRVGGANG